ncbi:phenylacetate--CoA ligase family protein [Fodinicola acaciae]|uniref:phenylacetate--CoA ligase family protein n=1 Tax=Fodinicola acaciae TaxID=2681555 RepID=UPI0013D1ABCC|nr:phenylacetate--CoA ligase family protein [Fodinicola acaciae]
MRRVRKAGPAAMAELQQRRLRELEAYAREHSAVYRERPAVTNKKLLMEHFDEWVTDPAVTLAKVSEFVRDPELAGTPFLGTYTVATTSGTTGSPGIFVKDKQDVAVNLARSSAMMAGWLDAGDLAKIVARGGRLAVVAATGGHFMVSAGIGHLRANWLARRMVRLFSVHDPLPELVAALNEFQPAILMGYGSLMASLAAEQEAGRLHISPVLVEPAGEAVPSRERMSAAFQAKVRDTYGCTECPYLTDGCAHGWYHVNTDWAIVEPVDENYEPVPPGVQSHTVLISNLANHVQPILRYDLGDSALFRPDRCECGNPLPALRVRGRAANVLTFADATGNSVTIPPLALTTLVDATPGVRLYQIVQTAPDTVRIRLRGDAVSQVQTAVSRFLAERGLAAVKVVMADEPPERSVGGKVRTVVPL